MRRSSRWLNKKIARAQDNVPRLEKDPERRYPSARALAEEGEQAPLCAAVAASVPFRLLECAKHLDRGFARVYQQHLLTGLKDIVRRKHAAWPLPPSVNVGRVLASRNFFEFDDAFTAPLNGFADAADYYRRTACGEVLDQVRTPTLSGPLAPRIASSSGALTSSTMPVIRSPRPRTTRP